MYDNDIDSAVIQYGIGLQSKQKTQLLYKRISTNEYMELQYNQINNIENFIIKEVTQHKYNLDDTITTVYSTENFIESLQVWWEIVINMDNLDNLFERVKQYI